ncbi:MAG: hypothetical protein HY921_00755 [Elusimicrobia bacterium]|nr:hypothetical protein [Elusimicrobiota bacterium]
MEKASPRIAVDDATTACSGNARQMRLIAAAAAFLTLAGRAWCADCPRGSTRMVTDDPLEPFRCVPDEELPDAGKPYFPKMGSFKSLPVAPKLRPSLEPSVAAPLPARTKRAGAHAAQALKYERYQISELSFDYPRGWSMTDGWDDELPTLYIQHDTGAQGRQVVLTISRAQIGQYGYLDLDTAVAKERRWQKAREGQRGRAAGLPARFTMVSGQSRSAYLDAGEGRYYILSYSAPEALFETFEPAFDRMLSSLRLARP